jgi:hypothetical protein
LQQLGKSVIARAIDNKIHVARLKDDPVMTGGKIPAPNNDDARKLFPDPPGERDGLFGLGAGHDGDAYIFEFTGAKVIRYFPIRVWFTVPVYDYPIVKSFHGCRDIQNGIRDPVFGDSAFRIEKKDLIHLCSVIECKVFRVARKECALIAIFMNINIFNVCCQAG